MSVSVLIGSLHVDVCVSLRTLLPSDELFSYPQYTHQAHADKPKQSHYNQMCVIEYVHVDQLFSVSFFKTQQERSNFPVHTLPLAKSLCLWKKQQNPLPAAAFSLRLTNMHQYISLR